MPETREQPRWLRAAAGPAGALAAIVLITGLLWSRTVAPPVESFDQHFYLGIAQDLRATGTFTDGFAFDPHPDGARPPGMRMGPLYPALLAAAAAIDPGLAAAMECDARTHNTGHCPRPAPIMRWLQFAMLAIVAWLIWAMAAALAGRPAAWLALALALLTTPLLLRSVDYLMTEMLALACTTAATAAAVAGAQRRPAAAQARWALAAGLALGCAALTRPGFFYLALAATAAAAAAIIARPALWRPAAAFAAGAALPIGAWIARNAAILQRPALSHGYDSHTLAQRVAFDAMTRREYAESFLCWLPDGTSLGRRFLEPGACNRFGWDDHPQSFYSIGQRQILPETLAAAGGYPHHLQYLLEHYVLAAPLRHTAVSLPLALRGAYVAHWWGFALLPVCLYATWRWRRFGGVSFLLIALPAWFMLLFNAAVAVNQVRYNLMLIPPYAIAGALVLLKALRRRLPRLNSTA